MKKLFFSLRRIVRSEISPQRGKRPDRDKILVERTNPTITRCPVRDNICVENVAYLTARPCSRVHPFSTNIASLKRCCPVKNVNEDFVLSAFPASGKYECFLPDSMDASFHTAWMPPSCWHGCFLPFSMDASFRTTRKSAAPGSGRQWKQKHQNVKDVYKRPLRTVFFTAMDTKKAQSTQRLTTCALIEKVFANLAETGCLFGGDSISSNVINLISDRLWYVKRKIENQKTAGKQQARPPEMFKILIN